MNSHQVVTLVGLSELNPGGARQSECWRPPRNFTNHDSWKRERRGRLNTWTCYADSDSLTLTSIQRHHAQFTFSLHPDFYHCTSPPLRHLPSICLPTLKNPRSTFHRSRLQPLDPLQAPKWQDRNTILSQTREPPHVTSVAILG